MNLHKVITRIAAALQDAGELRRVARALGNELPRHRLDVLRSFRAEMARFSLPEGSFAAGYIAAMLDVTAEFETCIRQSEDIQALEQLAVGEGAREVLLALAPGARLPSDIATLLGKDRSTIAHALKRLRAAGLVETSSNDQLDGRMRPHRLTPMGRRVADGLKNEPAVEMQRGIRVAVALFRHLMSHPSSTASELDAVAAQMLADANAARAVVNAWAKETKNAGLIIESTESTEHGARAESTERAREAMQPDTHSAAQSASEGVIVQPEPPAIATRNSELSRPAMVIPPSSDNIPQPIASEMSMRLAEGTAPHPFLLQSAKPALDSVPDILGNGVVDIRNDELWRNIPGLISQLQAHKDGDIPVFVRTSDVGWGAWAYALHQSDRTGKSRTIVNGDILSHALEPPLSRFALVYDDPAAISADAQQPTMRAFMERADEKFVVTNAGDDVPEGFIQLTMAPGRSAG